MAWFFAPYRRRDLDGEPSRYCLIDDFTGQIVADGADPRRPWAEAECLGGYAVVKVAPEASAATLAAIAATAGFRRVPVARLDDTLDTLTLNQRQQLRTFLGSLGYTGAELQARFGAGNDLAGFTLGDVLRFALTRRLQPRYDQAGDAIILDGPVQPTTPVERIDAAVA